MRYYINHMIDTIAVGSRIGTWTVESSRIHKSRNCSRRFYTVRCDCGAKKMFRREYLKKICRICTPWIRRHDIAGKKFGLWTVIAHDTTVRDHRGAAMTVWIAECICGLRRSLTKSALRAAWSCGCQRRTHPVHGHTVGYRSSATYSCWKNMISRCTQPSNPGYAYYKRRGIKLCRRWRKFANFLADMGERPDGLTIDRIQNDGHYTPGNCQWATRRAQANNRVTNVRVQYRGRSYTIADLARATGVSRWLLISRLRRCRRPWTVEGAVDTPPLPKGTHFSC